MIRDHSDHGRSNELMNPCPEWIHRFIWSTVWFPCEMSAEIPYWWHSSASVRVYLVMPHGKLASTNQRHHLDLRLFTVRYFSIKPSRSSAMHYLWPSLVSYELMGGHQWALVGGGRCPTPQVHLTLITRLDSVHMKPRLSPMMQSTQSHRKNRVLYEQST